MYPWTAASGDDGSGLDQVACKLTKFRLNSNLNAGTWASLPGFRSMKLIGLADQSTIEKIYTPSFQSPTVDVAYFLVDLIEE